MREGVGLSQLTLASNSTLESALVSLPECIAGCNDHTLDTYRGLHTRRFREDPPPV